MIYQYLALGGLIRAIRVVSTAVAACKCGTIEVDRQVHVECYHLHALRVHMTVPIELFPFYIPFPPHSSVHVVLSAGFMPCHAHLNRYLLRLAPATQVQYATVSVDFVGAINFGYSITFKLKKKMHLVVCYNKMDVQDITLGQSVSWYYYYVGWSKTGFIGTCSTFLLMDLI